MKNYLFLLILFCQSTFSQNWTQYTPSDNLIDGIIFSIQKFNNNHYACTWAFNNGEANGLGLGKFDGSNWVKISNPNLHNEIDCLLNDNNGNLWLGTFNGLTKYDGNQFVKYTTADGLPSNQINEIKKDATGKLWIATNFGVATFENGNFTIIPELVGKTVYTFEFINSDTIWFSVHPEGIYMKNLNSWSILSTNNGLSSNSAFVIKKGNNSDVWIGHYNNSFLDKYDLSNSLITKYNLTNGLPSVQVRAIEKDVNGNIYFGTNNGLSKFNGTTFESINFNGTGTSNVVRSIFFDNSELWIGTFGGISRNSSFLGINNIEKLNENIIYPIPASNYFIVQSDNKPAESFEYNIIDFSGKIVKKGNSKFNKQIDIEHLTIGNYIIKIETESGEKISKKLIKN